MGSAISRAGTDAAQGAGHDALYDRCAALDKANMELRGEVAKRDANMKKLRDALSSSKAQLDSTQSSFFDLERQLHTTQTQYKSALPTIDRLRTELTEAKHDLAARTETVSKLRASNSALEHQAKSATTKAGLLQEEIDSKDKEFTEATDSLRAKNKSLREQLQAQQQELSTLKKSISMINNIVDNTPGADV